VGSLLGGTTIRVGVVGLVLLGVAASLLVWLIVRSRIGARRLRRHIDGPVHPALGAARLFGRPVPTPTGVSEQHGIGWRPGLTLDMIHAESPGREPPVFVYAHGGGWTSGDPQRQARDRYHALALDGWVVLGVRYPFAPQVTVEHQIETIRQAVRWARHELADLGILASRVVAAGGSAGGHLAAMAALTASDDAERVDACVGIYGVYDMANRNRTRAHWNSIRDQVMLATYAEQPERYRAVSPIDQDVSASPPFLIVHGTHDTLVPIGEGEQFAAVLRAAGRPVDVLPVYGAQHAFDAVSSTASRTTAAAVRTWLARTVLDH
jgi:acetyl esterase/lipase